ncbi:N-acetylmuramoyl-L-alanine amidase family protein [Amedibacillus sp. YH-ame10]
MKMVFILSCLFIFVVSGTTISYIINAREDSVVKAVDNFVEESKEETSVKQKQMKGVIVIDPGHGGYDPGSDFDGVYEKDVVLSVAKYMGAYLEKNDYRVVYTRDKDVSVGDYEIKDLQNRVDIASANQADLFVSLHLNFSELVSQRAYGFDTYANEGVGESMNYANNIMQELSKLNYSQARYAQNGDTLHVVKKNERPAVLVEMGFVSDSSDLAYLRKDAGQKAIGEAIAKAVINTKQEK